MTNNIEIYKNSEFGNISLRNSIYRRRDVSGYLHIEGICEPVQG